MPCILKKLSYLNLALNTVYSAQFYTVAKMSFFYIRKSLCNDVIESILLHYKSSILVGYQVKIKSLYCIFLGYFSSPSRLSPVIY